MLTHGPLTEQIIGCAIEVHKALRPGLLESAYESCLAHELNRRKIPFQRQVELPVGYRDCRVDCGFRIDLIVAEEVIVELKSIESIERIHEAQLLTYLKLARKRVGLLINFNVSLLRDGIFRRVL